MFTVKIKTDGAAFGEEGECAEGYEVARILRKIADRLECGGECGTVMDINGNSVGEFSLTRKRKVRR